MTDMYDRHPVPQYQQSFCDFLASLRMRRFRAQSDAATYFHCHRSTISRYETGDVEPPIGYLAHLLFLVSERHEPTEPIRETLLKEANRAIRRVYQSEPPFRSWESLIYCSQEYIDSQLSQSDRTERHEEYESHVEVVSSKLGYWGVSPDISRFQNRLNEIEKVCKWIIDDRCRLIGIIGLAGMGKSMLAKKIAVDVAVDFDCIMWLSLQIPLPLQQVLHECIKTIEKRAFDDIPSELNLLLNHFIEAMRSRRCLLVLDNLESVLDELEPLIRLSGRTVHKSCVLITSRQKPEALSIQEGSESVVRSLALNGVDTGTARMILQHRNLTGRERSWRRLVADLSGNPLALEMISGAIVDLYGGEISRFLNDTDTLMMGNVRELVAEQYEGLSAFEQQILMWMAVAHEPRSAGALQTNLAQQYPIGEIFDALHSLQHRSLVLRVEAGFGLHELVRSFLLNRLIEQAGREILTGQIETLNQIALLTTGSQEYIRQAQRTHILTPIVQRISNLLRTPEEQLGCFSNLLDGLRSDTRFNTGYAAGNLFNLARVMGIDCWKLDFSRLPLWQADMMGADLRNSNFRHADLRLYTMTQLFDTVRCMDFSHDGAMLAAGTITGAVRIWDILRGRQLAHFREFNDWVLSVCFDAESKYLYCAGSSGQIKQFDIATNQHLRTIYTSANRVLTVAISPKGNLIAAGGDDSIIQLLESGTGELIRSLSAPMTNWVHEVDFHPNKPLLLSGNGDGSVRLWDLPSGICKRSLQEHKSWIWNAGFSPDGKHFASCGQDGLICVWSTESCDLVHRWDLSPRFARCITFNKDGQTIIVGQDNGRISLRSLHSGDEIAVLDGHQARVWSMAVHPQEPLLVSAADDRSIRTWHLETYRAHDILDGYSNSLHALAVSPEGHLLAVGGADCQIHLWDSHTADYIGSLDGHTYRINSLAFNPVDGTLISGSFDRTVRIWDVEQQWCRLVLPELESYVSNVAVSPDGETVAASTFDLNVRIWDATSGALLQELPTGHEEFYAVAFSPDGQHLVLAGEDRMLWIWDLVNGEQWRTISGHEGPIWGLAFSADGRWLAGASSDRSVRIWDVKSWEEIRVLWGHTEPVEHVAFAPHDKQLASGGLDGTIRLWDVDSGESKRQLIGHESTVYTVAYVNEQTPASCSKDGTARLWDLGNGECTHVLAADRLYEGMDITGATGLSDAQRTSLKMLGAVED